MAQVIVRFTNPVIPDVVLPKGDTIQVNQIGIIVVMVDGEPVGLFPAGSVAGVYMPDEPSIIAKPKSIVDGLVIPSHFG